MEDGARREWSRADERLLRQIGTTASRRGWGWHVDGESVVFTKGDGVARVSLVDLRVALDLTIMSAAARLEPVHRIEVSWPPKFGTDITFKSG